MTLLRDLRYSLRMLLKNPLTTAVAIVTLALGIGANTAIFSLMRQALVGNFQYKDLDTLVIIQAENKKDGRRTNISAADLRDFRDQNSVFEALGTFRGTRFIMDKGGEAYPLSGFFVTTNLFHILGIPPLEGRLFRDDEGLPGNDSVVLLSEGFWTRQLGRDPAIVGKQLRFNGELYTVVGVMPTGFWREGEAWVPMVFTDEEMSAAARGVRDLRVWGRLKPGVTIEEAQSEFSTLAERLAQEFPETNGDWGAYMLPPDEVIAQQFNMSGILFLLPVGFVLLIACANVAHIQLARALERRKEIALRTALGAGRFKIIRQLLVESILVALLGGLLGLGVAYAGVAGLMSYLPPQVTQSIGGLRLDTEALTFMLIISCASGILFGLAPAWQASRVDVNHTLKEGSTRASAGKGGKRFRDVLLVSEIALTTVLLGGAGLILSMLGGGAHTQLGFNQENLLTMAAILPGAKYQDPDERRVFAESAVGRLNALPGIQSAIVAGGIPLLGGGSRNLTRVGEQDAVPKRQNVTYRPIWPGYFETLEVPLRVGRTFTARDVEGSTPVVIVNEALAREYFPGKNPIGERIILSAPAGPPGGLNTSPQDKTPPAPREIVGIVADVKQQPVEILPQAGIAYVPFRQDPPTFVVFAARTLGPPSPMTMAVVNEIRPLAPDLQILIITNMETLIHDAIRGIRFVPTLLTAFALLGLILAAVGTYGTSSYSMLQRTQEFGIRMALGAEARDVLRMVLKQGLKLTAIGFALGAAGVYGLVKIVISQFPVGGGPQDELLTNTEIVVTTAAVMVLLAGVGMVANYLPARRATKIDPMAAVRYE